MWNCVLTWFSVIIITTSTTTTTCEFYQTAVNCHVERIFTPKHSYKSFEAEGGVPKDCNSIRQQKRIFAPFDIVSWSSTYDSGKWYLSAVHNPRKAPLSKTSNNLQPREPPPEENASYYSSKWRNVDQAYICRPCLLLRQANILAWSIVRSVFAFEAVLHVCSGKETRINQEATQVLLMLGVVRCFTGALFVTVTGKWIDRQCCNKDSIVKLSQFAAGM